MFAEHILMKSVASGGVGGAAAPSDDLLKKYFFDSRIFLSMIYI